MRVKPKKGVPVDDDEDEDFEDFECLEDLVVDDRPTTLSRFSFSMVSYRCRCRQSFGEDDEAPALPFVCRDIRGLST